MGVKTPVLVSALFLLPATADAVVCKTVQPDGTVSYSDVPAADCANPVKLPDYSRYAPRVPRPVEPPPSAATGSLADAFAGYESVRIVQPEQNGTVRNNEGIVPVVLVTEPALEPGHQVEITLDGRKVEGRFVLNGVERGTHSVRAAVLDAAGAPLVETPAVRFTLRKTGLFDLPAEPEQPIEPQPPVAPAPPDFSPSDEGPDYAPTGQPDYSPPAAPSAATPGATNPAFAPDYGG
jgi:hypothetical protein